MSFINAIRPQAIEDAQENASWYGECASARRFYAYVGNDPLNGVDPLGTYTLQLGGAGSVSIPFTPINVPLGFGVAIDTQGRVGLYGYAGLGGQVGGSAEAGVSVQASNAKTIFDLSGPFFNTSLHGGLGFGGSLDFFTGSSPNGPVEGGGTTFGAALGASASGGVTSTVVYAPGMKPPLADLGISDALAAQGLAGPANPPTGPGK